MINEGHYGFLFKEEKQIGGFLYWTKKIQSNKIVYFTNNWWLFEDVKKCSLRLYESDGRKLNPVLEHELVELKHRNKLTLDCEMKGNLKINVIIDSLDDFI